MTRTPPTFKGRTHPPEWKHALAERSRGNKYGLGKKHTEEWKRASSERHRGNTRLLGKTLSPEHRAHISEAQKKRCERLGPPRPVWKNTRLEQTLVCLLESTGFTVEREKRFGRYRVDVYLPERHLALEADGRYAHSRPGRVEHDARRDADLLGRFSLPVVRITESELQQFKQAGVVMKEPVGWPAAAPLRLDEDPVL